MIPANRPRGLLHRAARQSLLLSLLGGAVITKSCVRFSQEMHACDTNTAGMRNRAFLLCLFSLTGGERIEQKKEPPPRRCAAGKGI